MLKPVAFASAIAITTAVLTVVLWMLKATVPWFFPFFFNAQFFGANVAALLPQETDPLRVLAEAAVLVAGAWGIGYLWALLYNRLSR
jgi:hypothetical protein